MNAGLNSARAWVTAALVASGATLAGCEDRGVPEDVPRTQTGGVARVSTIGQGSNVGGGTSGRSGRGPGSPQGAAGFGNDGVGTGLAGAGGAGIPGLGGSGGSAGIPGTGATGGSAGIPGTGATGGSAGIPGTEVAGDGAAGDGGETGSLGIGGALGGVGTNIAPAASLVASPQCISDIQRSVTLASSSVDADGDSLRCSWEIPAAVPSSSDDCTVTVTFSDPAQAEVVLHVDDGERVSSATAAIEACPAAVPGQPAVP